MHARWCQFSQKFSFKLVHNVGTKNKVVDVLSERENLLIMIKQEVVRFDEVWGMYETDENFHDG